MTSEDVGPDGQADSGLKKSTLAILAAVVAVVALLLILLLVPSPGGSGGGELTGHRSLEITFAEPDAAAPSSLDPNSVVPDVPMPPPPPEAVGEPRVRVAVGPSLSEVTQFVAGRAAIFAVALSAIAVLVAVAVFVYLSRQRGLNIFDLGAAQRELEEQRQRQREADAAREKERIRQNEENRRKREEARLSSQTWRRRTRVAVAAVAFFTSAYIYYAIRNFPTLLIYHDLRHLSRPTSLRVYPHTLLLTLLLIASRYLPGYNLDVACTCSALPLLLYMTYKIGKRAFGSAALHYRPIWQVVGLALSAATFTVGAVTYYII